MTAIIVLAALIGAVDLLLLLPVGLDARYRSGELSLTARAGPVRVKLLPREPVKRQARAADRDVKDLLRRVPGPVLRAGAGSLPRAAGHLHGRVRLRRLIVRFTAGGDDPCRAVMAYARAGIAMEGVRRLCPARGEIDLRTDVDFGGKTSFVGQAAADARLGYVLAAAICFGAPVLREYYRYRRKAETEG